MARKSSSNRAIIVYATQIIGGIKVRPDSRSVLAKALEGHPIEVHSGNAYINLYHVFERMVASTASLTDYRLTRHQVGPSRWLLFAVPPGQNAPALEPESGYDPKRGRYKRWAASLAAGNSVVVDKKTEAWKARRAWQLYVPGKKRKHLISTVRKLKTKFIVTIRERDVLGNETKGNRIPD